MFTVRARNVHEALPQGLHLIEVMGVSRQSRNGPVTVLPEPCSTHYEKPCERVLFYPERDANPFFHLFESLWMIAGRNDVEFVAHYVKTMKDFSDDGKTFHGAYGYRWVNYFGVDQLQKIIQILDRNRDDRRAILQMWDAFTDLGRTGKDFPCNLSAVFGVGADDRLNMTVYNRSNDMVWGAYGANAVHFSFLQEYVARSLDLEVGWYEQISANMHAYQNDAHAKVVHLAAEPLRGGITSPYSDGTVEPFPIMQVHHNIWNRDLQLFFKHGPVVGMIDPFFTRVVTPMYHAHAAFKKKDYDGALEIMQQCSASDWRVACTEWLERRKEKANV